MGNITRIGPYETSPIFGYSVGYRDDRNTKDIESLLGSKDHALFAKLLGQLNKTFQSSLSFNILDSGCGYGYTLKSLADIAASKNIHIHTTGITMQKDHEVASKWVDTLILGSLQNAYSKNLLTSNSFHFIIDICGPAFFFPLENNEERGQILSIYSNILAKKGLLLLYLLQLNPDNVMLKSRGITFANDIHAKTITMLEENGFKVVFNKKEFALVERK